MKAPGRMDILVNPDRDQGLTMARNIQAFLEARGHTCTLHDAWNLPKPESLRDCTCVITLGGDGTVLAAARLLAPLGIPIFPVNMGTFGFITEVGVQDWQEDLLRLLEGKTEFCQRLLLECRVKRDGVEIFQSPGLNEVVLSGAGISKLIRFEVSLKQGNLGAYKADGMIVASPTGSTAYAAAAGGPILHPHMEAMILCPICAFTLSHRPVVLPADEEVCLHLTESQRTGVILTVDGQLSLDLRPGDRILVRDAGVRVRVAFSRKRNFYDVLRTKLNWSGGYDA